MTVTKNDYDKINSQMRQIIQQSVNKIEVINQVPSSFSDLGISGKEYSLKAAVLFIEIRESTYLIDNNQAKSMVKIYRALMQMAFECINTCDGITGQFLGDRIMGVFLDTIDESEKTTESSVEKAINCAASLQTSIDFGLNRLLKNNLNGKVISYGIGIEYGKVLLTRFHVEDLEEEAEVESDYIWTGSTINKASKYADLAGKNELFISENTFKQISGTLKASEGWKNIAKHKSGSLYKGYIIEQYYLDFAKELGKAVIPQEGSDHEDAFRIADSIREIDQMHQKLITREVEIRISEEKLKQDRSRCEIMASANQMNKQNLETLMKQFVSKKESYYSTLRSYVKYSYGKENFIDKMGLDFWRKLIEEIYELGNDIGKTSKEITLGLDCQLIGIYDYFAIYNKAFEIMIVMAEANGNWISLKKNTLLWASGHKLVWKLKQAIEDRLKDINHSTDKIEYQKKLNEIKSIVGY